MRVRTALQGNAPMSLSVTGVRPRRPVRLARSRSAEVVEQGVRRRLYVTYGLLFFNALTFYPGISFIHIPSIVGKGLAQAALPVALLMALSLNRRSIVRPNVFLCLVTLLVLGAVFATLQPQHFGTVFRTFRLAGYVATLWLLTPWWGRRDLLLVRCHLATLSVLLGSAVIGLVVSPNHALAGGGSAALCGRYPPPSSRTTPRY